MSLLEKLNRGKKQTPPRIVVYGPPGVGKSTWASKAPNPVFIPIEDGIDHIDCVSFDQVRDLPGLVKCLNELLTSEHDFKTVVIDSLTALQTMISDAVCNDAKVKFVTAAYGGFGRGYDAVLSILRKEVFSLLERLRSERKMCIVMIAHDTDATVKHVDGTTEKRIAPRLFPNICDYILESTDAVLSADFKTIQDASGNYIRVGKDGGDREMYAVDSAKRLAKNRYGLPAGALPFNWGTFAEAVKACYANGGSQG